MRRKRFLYFRFGFSILRYKYQTQKNNKIEILSLHNIYVKNMHFLLFFFVQKYLIYFSHHESLIHKLNYHFDIVII
jgi:hypothetical protein